MLIFNLALFVLTTLGYGFVAHEFLDLLPETVGEWVAFGFILSVLCAPFTKDGNVYTVLGNALSEKNSYALFSLIQCAEESAWAFASCIQVSNRSRSAFNFGAQYGKKDARTVLGIMVFQNSKEESVLSLGFVLLQESKKESVVCFGIVIIQHSGSGLALVFLGLAVVQVSEHYEAGLFAGFTFFQKGEFCMVAIGITMLQIAKYTAEAECALVIFQRVPKNMQLFSVNSGLIDSDEPSVKS